MQPENLECVDCNLNTIFRNASKNTQTGDSASISTAKPRKLPLPRDLIVHQRSTLCCKSNKVDKGTCKYKPLNVRPATLQQNKKAESCEAKTSIQIKYIGHKKLVGSQLNLKDSWLIQRSVVDNDKIHNNDYPESVSKPSKHGVGENKSNSSLKNSTFPKTLTNSYALVPLLSCNYSNTLETNQETEKCFNEDVCPKRPSNKSLKKKRNSSKNLCSKQSDKYLKRQCEKYLVNKFSSILSKKRSKDQTESTCDEICKGKYLRKQCEKFLKKNISKNLLEDRKKGSCKDINKNKSSQESLKKKKCTCNGTCNEKSLEKECEENVRKKCLRIRSQDRFNSCSDTCPVKKKCRKDFDKNESDKKYSRHESCSTKPSSSTDVCKESTNESLKKKRCSSEDVSIKSDKYLKRQCEKYLVNKLSSIHSTDESKYRTDSSCEGICKGKFLRKKCEKYIQKKLSGDNLRCRKRSSHKDHTRIQDSCSDVCSVKKQSYNDLQSKKSCCICCRAKNDESKKLSRRSSKYKTSSHPTESPNKGSCSLKESERCKYHQHRGKHSKDRSCSNSSIYSKRKSSHRDLHRKGSCQDICNPEIRANLSKKNISHKNACKKKEEICNSSCKKCSGHKRSHKSLDKIDSSSKLSICKPFVESDKVPCKQTETGEPVPHAEHDTACNTNRPSREFLYIYPCKKGEIRVSEGECKISETEKSSHENIKMNIPSGGKDNKIYKNPLEIFFSLNTHYNNTPEGKNYDTTVISTGLEESVVKLVQINSLDSVSRPSDSEYVSNDSASEKSSVSSMDSCSRNELKLTKSDQRDQTSPRSLENSDIILSQEHSEYSSYESTEKKSVPKNISDEHDSSIIPKSMLDAHNKAISTIKFAVQDMICKAASTIQSDCAKQLEAIKKFRCDDDDDPSKAKKPRKCNDDNKKGSLKNLINILNTDIPNATYVENPSTHSKKYNNNVEFVDAEIVVDNLNSHNWSLDNSKLLEDTIKMLEKWNSIQGASKNAKSYSKTSKPSSIKTIDKMDSKPSRRCFTNPNIKNMPTRSEISISNLKNKLTDLAAPSRMSLGSTEIAIGTIHKITSADSQEECIGKFPEKKKKTLVIERKDRINPDSDVIRSRPVPVNISRCCSCTRVPKDPNNSKTFIEAHNKAVATIKCAMKDLICKAYFTTSEMASSAASVIQTESTKQLEKLKKLGSDDKCNCKPKKCSDKKDSKTSLKKLVHGISSDTSAKKCTHESENSSLPYKIISQIAETVNSAISLVRAYPFMSCDYNDSSSKYDVPDPNIRQKKNKPKQVSNETLCDVSPSTNNMITTLKDKILSLFMAEINDEESPSSIASSISIVDAPSEKEQIVKDVTRTKLTE